jgi:hypothetical protein
MEINLKGNWDFLPDLDNKGEKDLFYLPESWKSKENVSLCQSYEVPNPIFSKLFRGLKSAWVKKDFPFSKSEEYFVYLVFFGVDEGKIWLNGKLTGKTKLSSGKQVFDVTEAIQEENTLIVKFENIREETAGLWKYVYVMEEVSVPEIARKTVIHSPKWLDDAVIYSAHPKDSSQIIGFQELKKRLFSLKETGINTIWLGPIQDLTKISKASDYYEINQLLGSKLDFQKLVEEAHRLNIRVIVDFVLNRSISAPKKTTLLKGILGYWVKEYHVDGYRLHVLSYIQIENLREVISCLRLLKKDIVMMAEEESPELYSVGFDLIYDWSFSGVMDRIHKKYYGVEEINNYILTQYQYYPQNSKRLIFLENYTTQTPGFTFSGESRMPFQAVQFFTPGVPMTASGQEEYEWVEKEASSSSFYKDILCLKKKASPLSDHRQDGFNFNKRLSDFEITRSSGGKTIQVVIDSNRNHITILKNGKKHLTFYS